MPVATTRAVETPFNLESGPLFRGELYRLADDWHVLLMTAHHIVCDGWSWGLIAEDIRDLYAEQVGSGPALEPAPAYADYVSWEVAESAMDAHNEHQRYWLSRLADSSLPVLDLPTDRTRPPVLSTRGLAVPLVWDLGLAIRIEALARALTELDHRAAQISDPQKRARFLQEVRDNARACELGRAWLGRAAG